MNDERRERIRDRTLGMLDTWAAFGPYIRLLIVVAIIGGAVALVLRLLT